MVDTKPHSVVLKGSSAIINEILVIIAFLVVVYTTV